MTEIRSRDLSFIPEVAFYLLFRYFHLVKIGTTTMIYCFDYTEFRCYKHNNDGITDLVKIGTFTRKLEHLQEKLVKIGTFTKKNGQNWNIYKKIGQNWNIYKKVLNVSTPRKFGHDNVKVHG